MSSPIKMLTEAACVLVLALILAGAAFISRPALRPMLTVGEPFGSESQRPASQVPPPITLQDARSLFDAGTALFADARPLKAYQMGHIRGAMHLDPDEFDSWSENFFSQFPVDTLIIAYCDGPRCPLSSELSEKLIQMGYEKVFVLKNGWSLWTAARLPTEKVAE